jgi:serine/threonine protein phosphatase 1
MQIGSIFVMQWLLMKTWILGDIHGRFTALMQVMERSRFDYNSDKLIFLGDVVDRGDQPFECILELLKIKNKVFIIGNHDLNFHQYIKTGVDEFDGHNGVDITKRLWQGLDTTIRKKVGEFFELQVPYCILERNLFVHGGILFDMPLIEQDLDIFAWDRTLWETALKWPHPRLPLKEKVDKVFIGHTPTLHSSLTNHPMFRAGVWNLDTGAAYRGGKLTIMNLETEEYVQSDEIV